MKSIGIWINCQYALTSEPSDVSFDANVTARYWLATSTIDGLETECKCLELDASYWYI